MHFPVGLLFFVDETYELFQQSRNRTILVAAWPKDSMVCAQRCASVLPSCPLGLR
jgi:hypothetical protein